MPTTVRSRSGLALTALATLGVLLAGCDGDSPTVSAGSDAGSPAAGSSSAAATTPSAGAGCGFDAGDTFVVATSAEDRDGTVVLTARPATFVCGGADNGHFKTAGEASSVQLAPSATVELLAGSGPELDPAPVAPADVPARLAEDPGALFQVTGPASAVTGLTEVYQP